MTSATDFLGQLATAAEPFLVFLATFAFLFASLGRSRIFHFERRARAVLAGILAFYAADVVLTSDWNLIVGVTATSVAIGLVGILVWHVALQRERTKEESVETVEEE